eukprot:m.957293 g.957293  ORF g.957293 m.957293 type:complete len:54 (+) comp390213_c0_seq1:3-164(+)
MVREEAAGQELAQDPEFAQPQAREMGQEPTQQRDVSASVMNLSLTPSDFETWK